MTAPSGSPDKGRERASEAYEHVACPFCGIMCDDLQIARTGANLKVRNTNCEKAVAGFERALAASSPQIDGKTVSLEAGCVPPPNSCARRGCRCLAAWRPMSKACAL